MIDQCVSRVLPVRVLTVRVRVLTVQVRVPSPRVPMVIRPLYYVAGKYILGYNLVNGQFSFHFPSGTSLPKKMLYMPQGGHVPQVIIC